MRTTTSIHETLIASALLVSASACTRGGQDAPPADPEAAPSAAVADVDPAPAEAAAVPAPTPCRLEKVVLGFARSEREVTFSHEGGVIVSATVKGGRGPQAIRWTRDDAGRLAGVDQGRSGLEYTYDDGGRVAEIDGRGSFSDRVFEHDEAGRVTRQIVKFRGQPFATFEYAWGDGPCPTVMRSYDRRKRHLETHRFTWGEPESPLAGLGASIDAREMMLGYPVGVCPYVLVEDALTFERRPSGTRNGKRYRAGDVLVSRYVHEVDADHGRVVASSRVTADPSRDTDAEGPAAAGGGAEGAEAPTPHARYHWACEPVGG